MTNKKIKVTVNLDFTSDRMSIKKIREQIDAAVSAVKINLDPESAKKFEAELRELGKVLERHLNQNTGKINAKNFVADLDNRENFLMIEKLGQRYAEVGVNAQQSFRKIANEADFLSKKITVSNKALEKMGTTLMNTIRWNISSSAVNAVTNEFRKMYYFAKDLDRVLTNIRIVTGQSADQMERFALAANESAKALGVSTIEYAQAATLFFQQGLKEVDVKKMTDGAIMASRITGIAAADMADLLTSTMNGYRLAADEVIKVTDKLAAVGATTASNFHEIATGMSKVASMANTAGVSIDELIAQIATIVSVTRESPESIGTSLKTIYGRMLMFKTDIEALMKDEDGELFGAPKVEEALQAYSRAAGKQISLFKITADGRKELRDLGEVIEEIGNSWDTVTDKTVKFGLATALAGSRQQNRLIALFDSWDMYKKAVETSLNAEGTTLRQNAIYLESYEGKLKELQAAKEELYMVLTDSGSMKSFIEALTKGVELFTKLADMAGGFSAVLGVIGAAFSDKLVKKAYEFQQAFVLPKEMKIVGKEKEQIESLEELHKISKAFGADEANRYREELRNKTAVLKEMKVESDLLKEKVTLLEKIKDTSKEDYNEAKKKAVIDNLIAEAEARGVAVESAEELRVKYNELAKAQQKLIELKKLSRDQITQEVKDAQAEVDAIQFQIDSIHKKAIEAAEDGAKASKAMEKQLEKTSSEISAKAKEAEKLTKAIQATRAAFMLLPAAISAATDDTKEWHDVLKSVGSTSLMLIPNIASEIISTTIATGGLTAAIEALGIALKTTFLPFLAVGLVVSAIGLLIKWIDKSIVTLEEQKKIVDELSDSVKGLQSEYDQLLAIEDKTDAQKNRLALLKAELDTQKELLNIEQERLINQQFFERKVLSHKDGIFKSTGAEQVKADIQELIDLQDKLANTDVESKEWKDLNERILEIKSSLIEQLKILDKGIKSYEDVGKKAPQHVIKLADAIREVVIEEEDLADAVEEANLPLYEQVETLSELTEEFETATSKIQDYYKILDELNSKEGLSAKSKQDIITKYHELLPYLSDEQELRRQLIQIIAKEEKAQQQAYANMLIYSEDFYNAKIIGNTKLVNTLNEKYGIDLKNYRTLAEAKLEIEKSLLETLGDMWSKYYDSTQGVMVFPDADTEMAFWNSAEGKAYRERRRVIDEFQRELDEITSEFFGSLKDINLSGIKGGKSSSTSAKDNRQFLETIDAEIRAIKIRNDHLIKTSNLLREQLDLAKDIEGIEGLNEQYRLTGEIIAHNEKILESFKEEQDAIHQRANDIREQYSQYDINSWFDANAEATVAYIEQYNKATKEQQEEMQKVFNWVQKLKQAWVEADNEIQKVLKSNKDLTRELEKHPEKVRKFVKELIELEKRNAYLDLEMRQREANERLKRDKEAMEREVRDKQDKIDELQSEIDRIQKDERTRQERRERARRLDEIAKLEDKLDFLENRSLGSLTEELAKSLDLEREREEYLRVQENILEEQKKKQEHQNKLLELRNKLDNIRNEKNIQQLKKLEDGTWQFEYVADQREIDKVKEQMKDIEEKIQESNERIEKIQKDHNKSIEKLKEQTSENLKRIQENYDEWERQNRIQRQIEEKQDRIRKYQDEIKDLQNKFSEIEELTNEAFKREKENLDRFYSDIDLLTDEKMKELDDTFDNNWSSIYDTITGYFNDIINEYRKLIRILSEPLPTPEYGEGGYYTPPSSNRIVTGSSSNSNTKDYGKGAATGQAAIDNEARLNSDPAFRQSEIERTKQVISNRKEAGMDTSVQERYLKRLITGSYHIGGIVGDGSRDLPEIINKLFNTKPNEQIVKALKGELFIPEENIFKNFLPNLQNLFSMVTPNITIPKIPNVAAAGGDTIYYINELTVPTDDFQSFIKDFTSVVENHPNKVIMKVKKIGGLR